MVSLWGSSNTPEDNENQEHIEEESQENSSMAPPPPRPASRESPDEQSRLLQPNRDTPRGAYLDPDDPAVSVVLLYVVFHNH
jgi:hypothetical protein